MSFPQIARSCKRAAVNLDWTRDPPPPTMTPYQKCIRDINWSKTALGPMNSWQRELRQIVLFMMAEIKPIILYWGNEHTIVYNEAHVPFVGEKHPAFLGMNASEAFPVFWSFFANVIDEMQYTGQARVGEAAMLLMTRNGFLEETYFDWKLIPIIGDDGTMLGGYGTPTELSTEIIWARRMKCIQSLTPSVRNVNSFDELWVKTMEALAQNDKDIPMAMAYTVTGQKQNALLPSDTAATFHLKASLAIPPSHLCAKRSVIPSDCSDELASLMFTALKNEETLLIRLQDCRLEQYFHNIEQRGFDTPFEEIVIVPIKADQVVSTILVLGLNPHLRFTPAYREFVKIIQDVLSPQVSRLRLAEEVKSREWLAQNALSDFQKSETRFARFAERSPLGLALTDKDGKVLYANEAWFNFCGLHRGEYEFANWLDTVLEEDLPITREWWSKLITHKQSGTFQIRSKESFSLGDKRMPYRTAIVAVYPDLGEDGEVSTVMGLVTDISELKWNEEQLRLRQREIEGSEKKYRDFAECAPVSSLCQALVQTLYCSPVLIGRKIGVVRTDADGYVQFANDTWRSFYNFDTDHKFAEPQPWLTSLNNEDAVAAKKWFEKVRSNKESMPIEVRMRRGKRPREGNRSTPQEFWLLATSFTEHDQDGSIKGINFWVTDISDQKAAEKVLTDKMEEAIRLRTTQERFVDMISHEIRNPLSAILHCGEEIVEAMRRCLRGMDGDTHFGSVSSKDSKYSEETRKHIDSALDAANTIMYCVQHQKQIVDDVLTLSKLDADLLVVSPIPVQPTELVRTALRIFEPELKASAIELSLDAKPSLDKLEVDWIMLDPNRFLQIVINLVTNAIKFTRNSKTRRIVISVDAREARPPRQDQGVHYVPRRTYQEDTDHESVNNAADLVSLETIYICFRIADTGKGLTESERTTLFERFKQASPKTHIEYGGSGLGLFISRQITEMLGGEIGVGSLSGQGATFAFYVRTQRTKPPRRGSIGIEPNSLYSNTIVTPPPVEWVAGYDHPTLSKPTLSNSRPSSPSRTMSAKPKRRVLVVEDNLVNQKVLCKQLRNRGFSVDAANHGREALDILEKVARDDQVNQLDVVLCDIEMPVMDGIECVTEIRRLEKERVFTGHIPIIGVTANVRSTQVNAAIEAGMDGITTKPYRIDELIAHIDRVSTESNR